MEETPTENVVLSQRGESCVADSDELTEDGEREDVHVSQSVNHDRGDSVNVEGAMERNAEHIDTL